MAKRKYPKSIKKAKKPSNEILKESISENPT